LQDIYFEVIEFVYEIRESKCDEVKGAKKREYIVISDSDDQPEKKSAKSTVDCDKSKEEIAEPKKEPKSAEKQQTETKPCTSKEAESKSEDADEKKDDYADALTCTICQEVMHDSVSLQPCNHSYCAGCYSEWMEKSDKCPICRDEVSRITRNPIIREVIEIYLKSHPQKQRSKDEIERLNNANKITNDMLYPKKERTRHTIFDVDHDFILMDDLEFDILGDEFDDEDELDDPFYNAVIEMHPYRPAQTICRQCPGAQETDLIEPQPQARVQQQQYPNFHCPRDQNHILCQCCFRPMPDRSNHLANRTLLTPQSCYACHSSFCHLYWGCRRVGCRGCLNRLEDFEFEEIVKDDLINRNIFETQVLIDWLKDQKKSDRDFLTECVRKLKNGVFKTSVITGENPHEKAICKSCAYKVLAELAYQYRAWIPKAQLPGKFLKILKYFIFKKFVFDSRNIK
jgi:E3 ubiquitin-protein ligase CHFR